MSALSTTVMAFSMSADAFAAAVSNGARLEKPSVMSALRKGMIFGAIETVTPIIGWLAARNDTVFLRRGSRGHARIINEQVAGLLGQGKHVAVFPEGTTTDGRSLLHFHAALLQPALAAGRPVLPAAISYWELDGQRSLAPRYDGDISLGECTRAILGCKRLIARLVTTPLRGLNGEDRRVVAAEAREAIALAAGLPMANNPPETPGDLPAGQRSDDRPTNSPSRAPAGST